MRYNEWFDFACHNCYGNGDAPFSDAFRYTRTFEIDITDQPVRGDSASRVAAPAERVWYVRHDNRTTSNANNCRWGKSKTAGLRECLEEIAEFMEPDSMRLAPVLTLYLDLKFADWSDSTAAADLDALLLDVLQRDRIFRPSQMVSGDYPTPAAAATAGAWPEMDQLRGKIIVVLTGGTGMDAREVVWNTRWRRNRTLHRYVVGRRADAVAFVAPDVRDDDHVRKVQGFNPSSYPYVAFFNYGGYVEDKTWGLYKGYRSVGAAIRRLGGVGRIWWGEDGASPLDRVCTGARAGFQRPAVYAISKVRACTPAADSAGTAAATNPM